MILNPIQHQQNGTKSAVQQKEPAIPLHYSIAKKIPLHRSKYSADIPTH